MTIFWPLKSALIYLTRYWDEFFSWSCSGHLSKELLNQNSVVCRRQGKKISCFLVLFCFIWLLLLLKKKVEVTLALLSHSSSLKIDLSFHCLHTIKTQLISIELRLSALLPSSFFYYPAPKLMNILEYLPNFALIEMNCLRLVFVEERKRSLVKKSNRC